MKPSRLVLVLLVAAMGVVGCAGPKSGPRAPAATFEGTLSQSIVPPTELGANWRMEQGLMIDDLNAPPAIPPLRKKWAEAFIRQRRAAGARSYGEVFYFTSDATPVKVSTLILVYGDAAQARAHWDNIYGPGNHTFGYRRTNTIGDKSVENRKHDEVVVLAGNVIVQASQPVPGDANDAVLRAYLRSLSVDRPAAP